MTPLFLYIAVEVPLEVLEEHSKGRNITFSCILPLRCPWRCSRGTQKAEMSYFLYIAAEVPLEVVQRHFGGG